MPATYAARTFLTLTAVVVAFQLALAAGVPWGELTMGGAYPGRLPLPMRAVAVLSAALLASVGAVVAARAGLALPRWQPAARRLIWAVVAYMLVGVVLNAMTPSPRERALWLPVTAVLAVCALVVARAAPRAP
jgi:cell division protein FtsW (lipid II flippase)